MRIRELRQMIDDANSDYEKTMAEVLRVRTERERELEKVKEKYEPTIKALDNALSEKWNNFRKIAKIYYDYACFKRDKDGDISNIICHLLSYVEGESFIPYTQDFSIQDGSIIIKEKALKDFDINNKNTFERLYNNGDLVMIDDGHTSDIELYNLSGKPEFKFGNYTYLTDFVEDLIQYRMDNNKGNASTISMEELYTCLVEFLSKYPELYKKSEANRKEDMSYELTTKFKIIDSKVKKLI